MPILSPGKTIRSDKASLLVENDLAVGTYRFRLTVLDDAGNESGPADIVVTVRERPVINPNILRDRIVERPVVTPARPVVTPLRPIIGRPGRGGGN